MTKNNSDDKNTIDIYFEYQEKYSKLYGNKTIVFMQIGSFHEAYSTETEGYNIRELEPILNVKFTRRFTASKKYNKNIPVDRNSPYLLGFPSISLAKYLSILTENGYTAVIFDQAKDGDKIKRFLVGIYSPGTYLSDRQLDNTNYILSAYMVEEKQLFDKNLIAIGVTLVDVTTGNSIVHEFYSNKDDDKFGLDELIRIMQTFQPTESIFYYHPIEINKISINNLKSYLELDKYPYYFYIFCNNKGSDKLDLLTPETFKINYQNDYLAKVFDFNHQLTLSKKQSPIEILDLEKKPYIKISLIIMLRYIANHNSNLLKNLSHPTIYVYHKHLILANNAIQQLNIIDSNSLESYNKKIESLLDVINKTSTPMGKRFLKQNLLNPLSQEDRTTILARYEMIDSLLREKLFKKINFELKSIGDMERMHRKMALGMISPYEFYRLDQFYQTTIKIIALLKDNILTDLLGESIVKSFLSYQIIYNKEFNFEELQKYNNLDKLQKYSDPSDVQTEENAFFKKGIYPKIDKIQKQIDYVWSIINSTIFYFSNLISEKCRIKKDEKMISVDSNEREGYYFSITKTREKILKDQLKKKATNGIRINLSVGETLIIERDDIIFKPLQKGKTKIFITPLVEHTLKLSQEKAKLGKLIKIAFIKSMVKYYTENQTTLKKISRFIAELDFLVSGAMVANEYYYCKPQIQSTENIPSYFRVKALRHAIIERLLQETEYIPNDIELGNVPILKDIEKNKCNSKENILDDNKMRESTIEKSRMNGVVLFSINSCGKCLSPDTKILMMDGSIKLAKEIKKGDLLMGDDSDPKTVLATCAGQAMMYKIVPIRGDPYIVNGPHMLSLKSSGYKSINWAGDNKQYYDAYWIQNHVNQSKTFYVKNYGSKKKAYKAALQFLNIIPSDRGKIIDISVDDYLKKPVRWRNNYYTYHVGVDYAERPVELDPYILGQWLGDGTSAHPQITTADQEIVDYYQKFCDDHDLNISKQDKFHYYISKKKGGSNFFLNMLRKYNLINNKHIPESYLINSRKVRLAVLAGLVDSDGHNQADCAIRITQKNKRLSDNIVRLVRSLGFWTEITKFQQIWTHGKNGPVTGTYYRMHISGNDFSELPLLLEYKRPHANKKTMKTDALISSFKIEPLGIGDYCGFELDGNHRFLLADYTVTHNSSFMKSIGLAIILAQIGYYVPAEEFIYEPYMALYARITSNDNIFKGLSSFALEMTELQAILKRTENNGLNTLVIGDEVCRGTEDTSGLAIVASTLMHLSQNNATFIFSSHLHQLPKLDEIKALENLRIFHLKVEYNQEKDCLVFDRKLIPGPGPSVYGLMVAKYLIKNPKFINNAEIIKKKIMKENLIDLPIKKSNFNKDLLVTCCTICNYIPKKDYHKELETHHIYFQKNCLEDGKIKEKPYLQKNRLYNLVVLCRKCHEKVHHGDILINGYCDTSIGPLLNYKINFKKQMNNAFDLMKSKNKSKNKSKMLNFNDLL